MEAARSFKARWIFPVDQPPLENGVIEVQHGTITALHNRPDPRAKDLGDVALLPTLINCHAHLEFSALESQLTPAKPFADWIKSLVRYRRALPASEVDAAIRKGMTESHATGAGIVGEIATRDWPLEDLPHPRPHLILFREILARAPAQIAEQLQRAERHLALQGTIPDTTLALSPHAPYSVHPDLLKGLVTLARDRHAPVAMHLAETTEELQLLADGTGPLVDMLKSFGVWDDTFLSHGVRILEYLQTLSPLSHALVIHGNYLDDEEIDYLATHPQLTLIYCPRTHAFFGHKHHPWQSVLAKGGRVALGTDGRGSNPDLNLWQEVRFLHQNFPNVNPALLLELATLRGAQTLGLESRFGSLTPGKQASLLRINLDADGTDPYQLLFASNFNAQMLI